MTIVKKTNAEWNALVKAYRETGSDEHFMSLFMALRPIAQALGKTQYIRYRKLGIGKSEYVNEAEFAIYRTVEKFDPAKNGSLPAMLKQMVEWGVSDNIIRPLKTNQGKFEFTAVSLDTPISGPFGDGTLADVAGHEFAVEERDVYKSVYQEDSNSMLEHLQQLIRDFDEQAKQKESQIVKIVFQTILKKPQATAQTINNELYEQHPDVNKATLRKRKERALSNFTYFARENGFTHADLSQF